jgi:hypothetical protein
MVCSTYLEEIASRVEDLRNRSRLIGATLTADQLNWSTGPGNWSIGQIYEHMHLGNSYYFPAMERAVEFGRYGGHQEVRHSLIGGAIIKAAGPQSNAPVPRKLRPGNGPFTSDVVQEFDDDHARILMLCAQAEDLDLTSSRIKNPILPIITMNLADAFEIVTAHAERHLGQIEQMVRRDDFPK